MSVLLEQNMSQLYCLKTRKSKVNENIELVELTLDNVARVEAMINTDSNYHEARNSSAAPYLKKKNRTYQGSIVYWMAQLKKKLNGIIDDECKIAIDGKIEQRKVFKNEIIREVISAVDRENSTHLNVGNGRKIMYDRLLLLFTSGIFPGILKCECSHIKKLVINYFAAPIPVKGKTKAYDRINYSFATKLCHCVCLYLFAGQPEEDNYSKYDDILGTSLVTYAKEYGIVKNKNGEAYAKEDFQDYRVYSDVIDQIRAKAEKETGYLISRNGFDHLLWYYHKGHPIK